MNWAQLYADLSAQLQAHVDLPFYQDFFVNFYRAFIDGARWKLYLSGLRMTIEVTVLALIMGIILGVIVAVIRTAHDQQRPGRHNPILFLLNTIGDHLHHRHPRHAHDRPDAHHGLRHLRQQPELHRHRHHRPGHQLRRLRR